MRAALRQPADLMSHFADRRDQLLAGPGCGIILEHRVRSSAPRWLPDLKASPKNWRLRRSSGAGGAFRNSAQHGRNALTNARPVFHHDARALPAPRARRSFFRLECVNYVSLNAFRCIICHSGLGDFPPSSRAHRASRTIRFITRHRAQPSCDFTTIFCRSRLRLLVRDSLWINSISVQPGFTTVGDSLYIST